MGRGNESLFVKTVSHDQDGRHAHIWYKQLKNHNITVVNKSRLTASFFMCGL